MSDNKNATIAGIIFRVYITAYCYEHTTRETIEFLEDFKRRMNAPFSGKDDESLFLRSMLVCAIGDYGTSPRSGWFEGKDYSMIKLLIDKEIAENMSILEDEEDEEDERT